MKNIIHRVHLTAGFIMRVLASIGESEKERGRDGKRKMINSHDFIGVGATSSCKFHL